MKKLFSLFLVISLLPAFALALPPEKLTCGDFEYILLEDGTAEITGYKGTGENLTIPAEVDGYKVTHIGDMAFYDREDLSGKLTIPEGIVRIGDSAFFNCQFSGELVLPDSLEIISEGAFSWCCFLSGTLRLPEALREIGENAFRICIGLKGKVNIPAGVTYIGEGAFGNCTGLTLFTVSKGNEKYKTVKGILFTADGTLLLAAPGGKTMNDYVIPDGVTRIAKSAFENCDGLRGSITFPDSVAEIGEYAFLTCVNLTGELRLPSGLKIIEGDAFYLCPGFTGRLRIPSGVTKIGWGAFSMCSGFTGKLVIPDTVTFIDSFAFDGCSRITSASIPDSVKKIGERAFGYDYKDGEFVLLPRFTISCSEGSAAAAYAEENGITIK
ncbi:MAG: leucine-rich repeat domain-containing protein [Clostridia bacterium]|nr:leucine-rich repeat domain-containing protein [Clostridia bacterium]